MNYATLFVEWALKVGYIEDEHVGDGHFKIMRGYDSRLIDIEIDPSALSEEFSGYELSAKAIWPDTDEQTAAFRLLSVHLEEALDTNPPYVTKLVFDGGRFLPG